MGRFVPQLTFNKFRKGEVAEIDEADWANLIERGWLVPYVEGEVVAAGGEAGEPEPTGDAPLVDAGGASPSEPFDADGAP